MKLTGKIAVITGGGRGIGRSIALAYAREGARVLVAARTADEIAETVWLIEELGREAKAVQVDIRDVDQIDYLAEQTIQLYGKPHILVNSAGEAMRAQVQEVNEEMWDTIHGTLLKGTFFTTRAFLPSFIDQRQGNIINIGAPIDKLAMPNFAAYASAKWGVEGLTRALAKELRRYGVNVNALHPGGFADTRLARHLAPDAAKNALPPDDVTAAAIFLATQEPRGTSGETINTYLWNKEHAA